jgi:hypothetical protein
MWLKLFNLICKSHSTPTKIVININLEIFCMKVTLRSIQIMNIFSKHVVSNDWYNELVGLSWVSCIYKDCNFSFRGKALLLKKVTLVTSTYAYLQGIWSWFQHVTQKRKPCLTGLIKIHWISFTTDSVHQIWSNFTYMQVKPDFIIILYSEFKVIFLNAWVQIFWSGVLDHNSFLRTLILNLIYC